MTFLMSKIEIEKQVVALSSEYVRFTRIDGNLTQLDD
jgi:hypothetical protein